MIFTKIREKTQIKNTYMFVQYVCSKQSEKKTKTKTKPSRLSESGG